MKIVVAAVLTLAAIVGLIAGVNALVNVVPDWALIALFFGGVGAIIFVAARVFGAPTGSHPLMARKHEDVVAELRAHGHLAQEEFNATRCIAVHEYEDEGLTYWLELTDGRLLCLTGQYLYEYERVDDDPELAQPRRFPCTEFTLRWHATEGYTVDLLCRGRVLEPEATLPPFGNEVWGDSSLLVDRRIVVGDTLDAVRARGGLARA